MDSGLEQFGVLYTMGGQTLETTDCERDIGVLVTSDLKPSDQCAKAARTVYAMLGQISRAFHYRDRWTFVKLLLQSVRKAASRICGGGMVAVDTWGHR